MARKDLSCNRCGKAMARVAKSLPETKARCLACRRIDPLTKPHKPKVKDLTCNRCGEPMWGSTLPQGEARCQPCRRADPQPTGGHTAPRLVMCPQCWQVFDQGRSTRRKFCSRACFAVHQGEVQRVRSMDDQHQQRCEREKNAPGLSRSQRSQLLTQWKRQCRACAYCDAPPTTVDHVVPLVRGGTNYEGNLVPCCKRCNSSKAGHMVIEWRTGKRLPRMGRALAWQNRVRVAKVIKVKPPKPTHPCPLCDTPTTCKVYCSTACMNEWWARKTRDKYRAAHGLTVDMSEPTKSWAA